MAVQFIDGKVLFVGGKVAMSPDCCCGPAGTCCTFDPERELFLNIDEFSIDGGGACNAGCVDFAISGRANFGGVQSSSSPVTWYTENCGDDGNFIIAYTLVCEDGLHYLNMFSSSPSRIIDNCVDNNVLCFIALDGLGNQLLGDGVAVCDPFFIQATLPIYIYDADGTTLCATGSMRVTISE